MDANSLIDGAARQRASAALRGFDQEQAERQFTVDQFNKVTLAVVQSNQILLDFLKNWQPIKKLPEFPTTIATPDTKQVTAAVKQLEKTLRPDNTAILAALEALATQIEALSTKLAPAKAVSVTNLAELSTNLSRELKTVLEAVHNLDVKPQVKVAAPKVTVEKTDVAGVVKALEAVKQAVDNKPVPGVSVTPTDPLIRYTPTDIDDAGAVQYFGYVDQRGGWYIRQLDTSASPKTIRFCFGNSDYPTNFTNRAALIYTIWSG